MTLNVKWPLVSGLPANLMITSQLCFVINLLAKYLVKYTVFLLNLHPQCEWKIHNI